MQTHSLSEFSAEAVRFISSLVPREHATVVALSGDLGAGKTTFTQAIARHFGVAEHVSSPTFVIEKIYELTGTPFQRLIHIDAYRLNAERELEALGWNEIVTEPGNLVLIEWPERVLGLIPDTAQHVRLQYIDEDAREISYGNEKNR